LLILNEEQTEIEKKVETKRENTVFILGAGASVPYGFPSSRDLRLEIIRNFLQKYAPLYGNEKNKYDKWEFDSKLRLIEEFQKRFNLSSIYSIDYFMSRHKNFYELGKDSIIIHLLDYESKCKFRESSKQKNSDWYSYLYNYMISNLRTSDAFSRLSNNLFTFITFNYERSLEYFLAESLGHSFEGMTNLQLKQVMKGTPIIHIYGKIAVLPFSDDEEGVKFGQKIKIEDLPKLRENIKTIGDNFDNIYSTVSEVISEAHRIFFLGFGYAKINLLNLGIPLHLHSGQKIFGTALGLNKRFIDNLKEFFIEENYLKPKNRGITNPTPLDDDNMIFEDVDSLSLLKDYL
jgi:hypothetical protein